MVRRHPHVFGTDTVENAEAQTRAWEAQKAEERQTNAKEANAKEANGGGTLAGVARGLPALLRAFKLQARAARVGFDWPDAEGALAKLREELDELASEMAAGEPTDALAEEVGDVLFSAVNVARKLGIEPEDALRRGNRKFEQRFAYVEQSLAAAGRRLEDTPLEDMEALWQEAKARAKNRV